MILKFEDFLNENANDAILKMRTTVLDILKKSNDKISKANIGITKDGKKMKLTSNLVDSHKPRYSHDNTPKTEDAKPATTNEPIGFVFNCEGMDKPLADFKITVTNANEVTLTNNQDAKEEAMKFNKHNVKYIPDEIQQKIEKKFGKIVKL